MRPQRTIAIISLTLAGNLAGCASHQGPQVTEQGDTVVATAPSAAEASRLLVAHAGWQNTDAPRVEPLDGRGSQLPMQIEEKGSRRSVATTTHTAIAEFRQRKQRLATRYREARHAYHQASTWSDRVTQFREAVAAYRAYKALFGSLPIAMPAPAFRIEYTIQVEEPVPTGKGRHPVTVRAQHRPTADGVTVAGTPVEVRVPSGRTASGTTDASGTVTLTIPQPRKPGTYAIQFVSPDPFGNNPQGWTWGEEGITRYYLGERVKIEAQGSELKPKGVFHDTLIFEATARVPSANPPSDNQAREKALRQATLKAKLESAQTKPELVGKTSLDEGRLAEQRYRRTIAAQLPEATKLIKQTVRYETDAVVATTVVRVPAN